jgi:general secretion pathway protein G
MQQNRKSIQSNAGFTLIELMLVTVIIGVLAGMVVMVFTGSATDAKVRAASGDIKMYQSALDLYALDNNDQYPNSLAQLVSGQKKYIRDLNNDPWGNAYIYQKPGQRHPESYDLSSAGPDGRKGTADDVADWMQKGN